MYVDEKDYTFTQNKIAILKNNLSTVRSKLRFKEIKDYSYKNNQLGIYDDIHYVNQNLVNETWNTVSKQIKDDEILFTDNINMTYRNRKLWKKKLHTFTTNLSQSTHSGGGQIGHNHISNSNRNSDQTYKKKIISYNNMNENDTNLNLINERKSPTKYLMKQNDVTNTNVNNNVNNSLYSISNEDIKIANTNINVTNNITNNTTNITANNTSSNLLKNNSVPSLFKSHSKLLNVNKHKNVFNNDNFNNKDEQFIRNNTSYMVHSNILKTPIRSPSKNKFNETSLHYINENNENCENNENNENNKKHENIEINENNENNENNKNNSLKHQHEIKEHKERKEKNENKKVSIKFDAFNRVSTEEIPCFKFKKHSSNKIKVNKQIHDINNVNNNTSDVINLFSANSVKKILKFRSKDSILEIHDNQHYDEKVNNSARKSLPHKKLINFNKENILDDHDNFIAEYSKGIDTNNRTIIKPVKRFNVYNDLNMQRVFNFQNFEPEKINRILYSERKESKDRGRKDSKDRERVTERDRDRFEKKECREKSEKKDVSAYERINSKNTVITHNFEAKSSGNTLIVPATPTTKEFNDSCKHNYHDKDINEIKKEYCETYTNHNYNTIINQANSNTFKNICDIKKKDYGNNLRKKLQNVRPNIKSRIQLNKYILQYTPNPNSTL